MVIGRNAVVVYARGKQVRARAEPQQARIARSMTSEGEIALLGGKPLFESPRPVGQLASPALETYLAVLKPAYDAGRLTGGALALRLEQRLSEYHGVTHCISYANAGIALTALMRVFAAGRRGNVVLPAFTFRGLPHFARWACQTPRFADVEQDTHALDPQWVERCIDSDTTSVLAVNNVHSAANIDALVAVCRQRGVPLFFDSVYGLGATYHGSALGRFGSAEVFSMHATKLLNGFEGGYISTQDADLAMMLRAMRDRIKAGLNEMHAAMALLSLEALPEIIRRNEQRYRKYDDVLSSIRGLRLVPYLNEAIERYNYEMATVEVLDEWPLTRDETVKVLRAERVLIKAYYSPPLHNEYTLGAGGVPQLPVSESLSKRFMQLPVGERMTLNDIERLGAYLQRLNRRGKSIADRLRGSNR